MKKATLVLALLTLGAIQVSAAEGSMYIEPQNGFETYIAAAMTKKNVPIHITDDKNLATYVLRSTEEAKPESTGGKVVRCLFAYCAGIEGTSTASVELVNRETGDVVWGYEVKKAGASNHQSKAEAIAKHPKGWLEKHPEA